MERHSISGVNLGSPLIGALPLLLLPFSDSVQIDNLAPRAGGEVVLNDGDSGASASFVAGDAPA